MRFNLEVLHGSFNGRLLLSKVDFGAVLVILFNFPGSSCCMSSRVAIIGTIFFIAIIDNFFKIIAIISVIGDKFGKIIQVIFVCNLHT